MDDWELLNQYGSRGSEEAFRTVADRYAGFVYHAALRQIGNSHLAQEVTQAVFLALAQKATKIPRGTVLSGWLFRATRYAVANLLREEARRKRREEQAVMMETTVQPDATGSLWEQISPHLNDALDILSQKDRETLLVRFIENKSHKEIGRMLGVTEDAAKMRVSRALEKLRLILTKRGFAISSTTLLTVLASNVVQAAPPGVANALATVAVAKETTAAASTVALSQGILNVMAWSKLKTTGVAIALLVASTTTTLIISNHKTGPNTQPSQKTAQIMANRTTPRGTLHLVSAALKAGDGNAFVENYVFNGDEEAQLKTTLEQFVDASARFTQANIQRFGTDAAAIMIANLPLVIPAEIIDSATERIEGDSAELSIAGNKSGRPVQLTRINGEWKIPAEGLIPLRPAVQIDLFSRLTRALDEATTEIPGGKYNTAMEALNAAKAKSR